MTLGLSVGVLQDVRFGGSRVESGGFGVQGLEVYVLRFRVLMLRHQT